MDELLRLLVERLAFLYAERQMRIVDSEATKQFGGNAYITMEGPTVRLRLARDRGQFFIDFQNKFTKSKATWFSTDLIRSLIENRSGFLSIIEDSHIEFLQRAFPLIEALFSPESVQETESKLKKLAQKRAKEMFG